MKEWFSAQDLADMKLPGLPGTKRGILELVKRKGWRRIKGADGKPLCRERSGRGGGHEFHREVLPPAAKLRLDTDALKSTFVPDASVDGQPEDFTADDALRRDARLALLTLADAHHANHPVFGRKASDYDFCARYNEGAIAAPEWVKGTVPSLSSSSLYRWRKQRDEGGVHGLAGRYGGRKGSSPIDRSHNGAVARRIVALIIKQPFLTSTHIRDLIAADFDGELPSIQSFQRWIARWKAENAVLLKHQTDPDGFKSTVRISGSDAYAHITRLNQLWEIDASPADVLTVDGRFNLYAIVDCHSRRMMAYISRTARTDASLLLVRRAIVEWGVPEELRTDNGADFTSRQFVSALNALAIRQDVTAPFSPEQKGMVERHIGTLQRGLMPLLPGFIGHSVADRKKIEARKSFAARLGESDANAFCIDLTAAELQSALDRWCKSVYENKPHRGLKGTTPFAKAAEYRGAIKRIDNERALDVLLAPLAGGSGWRVMGKQGLRVDNAFFIARNVLPGQRVFCRQDPEDMGRLYVFEGEHGKFLDIAVCPIRAGIDPRKAVAEARNAQRAMLKEQVAEIRKEARKIKPRDMIDKLLGHHEEANGSVAAFPKQSTRHSSSALDEAGVAADEADYTASLQDLEVTPEREQADQKVVHLPETPKQRFRRALAIKAAIEAGEPVDADDARFLGGYEQTPEYSAHSEMLNDFGAEWLEA